MHIFVLEARVASLCMAARTLEAGHVACLALNSQGMVHQKLKAIIN